MIIIGGGLGGLSVGCYARMNGYRTHILEHNLELGGVCTAWPRGPYLVDGCIHWLMGGGPGGLFRSVYEELGILPDVDLRVIDQIARYEFPEQGWVFDVSRDFDDLRGELIALAPEDAEELRGFFEAVEQLRELRLDTNAPELHTFRARVRELWDMRRFAAPALRFRGSVGEWSARHLKSAPATTLFRHLFDPAMPMLFGPLMLAQLSLGQLSRPVGGSGRFKDAVVRRYQALGGDASVHTTVEEVLVERDRAVGVRLTDGTTLAADVVVSTAGAHETALRLLGGRYLDATLRERLDGWPLFRPIALVSLGVAMPCADLPSALWVGQREPIVVGGHPSDGLYLRVYNDDPAFAPPGHCVVQTLLGTDYAWWARRGLRYNAEKDALAREVIERVDRRIPGFAGAVRMQDVATPLTFWRYTRSWRGAYEGWLPTPETFRAQVPRTLPGLERFYLAGQWVEPGGGVPAALVSGRQLVQVLCEQEARPFRTSPWRPSTVRS